MKLIHYHFEKLNSTNNWAKDNIEQLDEKNVSLITADMQTAGRGRFNRKWVSPRGKNIYATLVFYIDEKRKDVGNLAQLLAISIIDALSPLNLPLKIKWPNDIFCNNKKIGGILCETININHRKAVINGFGININMTDEDLELIDTPATSILKESKQSFCVQSLTSDITKSFVNNLEIFLQKGFSLFLPKLKSLCFFPSNKLFFTYRGKKTQGTFQKINDNGSITILLSNNKIISHYSGEIF